jgi:hypothetical protein
MGKSYLAIDMRMVFIRRGAVVIWRVMAGEAVLGQGTGRTMTDARKLASAEKHRIKHKDHDKSAGTSKISRGTGQTGAFHPWRRMEQRCDSDE